MKIQLITNLRAVTSLLLLTASFMIPVTVIAGQAVAAVGVVTDDSNNGTPVGPPKKVIMCHNGNTISVSENAVPAHLKQGDTLGPCADDVVINVNNGNKTLIVSTTDLPGYLAHGASLGPASNKVFMCNNAGRIIVVDADKVAEHIARGQTEGLCPGFQLICHNGHTVKCDAQKAAQYLADGGYAGYCLGAEGPVITNLPPQVQTKLK